jgi:hypothetical protein
LKIEQLAGATVTLSSRSYCKVFLILRMLFITTVENDMNRSKLKWTKGTGRGRWTGRSRNGHVYQIKRRCGELSHLSCTTWKIKRDTHFSVKAAKAEAERVHQANAKYDRPVMA